MFKISKNQRLIISGILVTLSLILRFTIGHELITNIVMIATAIVAGTPPILLNAIAAARYKIIGIDALVSIAVVGAMLIGEYWEAAAVTFLFMFGDYLESRTIEKNKILY